MFKGEFLFSYRTCFILVFQISVKAMLSFWLFNKKTWESFLTPYFISHLSTDSQANFIWSTFKLYLDSDHFSSFLLPLFCSKLDFFNCLLTDFPTSTFALTPQWIFHSKARMIALKFKQYLVTPILKILQFFPILLKLTYLVPIWCTFK